MPATRSTPAPAIEMATPAKTDPVFVAGHRGLVGSAVLRALEAAGYTNLLTRRSSELDLRDQRAVYEFFAAEKPRAVVCAAAKVGGIVANNDYPGTFIHDNLAIQTNVIEACRREDVGRLIYLGSTCIYPKLAEQPIREESLLTGPLEPTNEAYAVAKIAGLKMCEAYARQYGLSSVTLMATNLYGPGDNFDLEKSHVIPALMRKAHEAKLGGMPSMEVWGSGTPLREFLHVDDMAAAARFCLENEIAYSMVNVGSGEEISIGDLTRLICEVVGFEGELVFDTSRPDGTPRKLADSSRLRGLGWAPSVGLRDGLAATYKWFLETPDARLDVR